MIDAFAPPGRALTRSLWLAGEIILAAADFLLKTLACRRSPPLELRAHWLHRACRRSLRVFDARVQIRGPIPTRGLLVSNHLSYLDILVLSALTPSVFVAKRQVAGWPVFGWFARLAGTLFADRQRRTQVRPLVEGLRTRLDQGALVVLFPEGTSSNGQTVLPFKSSLLEPVAGTSHPVHVCLIEYWLEDGNAGEEVCYWKDMTLVPHLLNLLSKRCVRVSVCFSRSGQCSPNRKELARHLQSEVLNLKRQAKPPFPPTLTAPTLPGPVEPSLAPN